MARMVERAERAVTVMAGRTPAPHMADVGASGLSLALPGEVLPTGLRLPEGLTIEQWLAVGSTLRRIHGAALWWVGDWLCYGERRYGETYREALDRTDYDYGTLRDAKWVSGMIELSRRHDNLSWSHHREVAALPPAVQDQWLDLAEQHRWGKRELRRQIKRGLPSPAPEGLILPPGLDLRHGDFRTVLESVPDGSVDAIITDPPYPREFLPLYDDLGALAARVLTPGGSLICMIGQSYLPDVLASLGLHLRYHWTVSYLGFGPHTVLWDRHVLSGWKPILWMTNGEYDGHQVFDVFRSEAAEKRAHAWRQSESGMAALVERFTDAGDVVLDPFLGTGTTGAVALALGRRFIGCENDPETFAIAEGRLGRACAYE